MVLIPQAHVRGDEVFVYVENLNQHLKWEIAAKQTAKKRWIGESKNSSHNAYRQQ